MQQTADLTTTEQTELDLLEDVIERGFKIFTEVGQALITIRDKRLYRRENGGKHDTFEDYCNERWHFTRQRAYQLISAAQIAADLSTTVDIPNESIARELARLEEPELRRAAVLTAIGTADSGKLTAEWVSSTVDAFETAKVTGGFVDVGDGEWTAINAAITAIAHEKMITKRKQLQNGKQKPLAIVELPAQALLSVEQIKLDVDPAEIVRVVIYRAVIE